jgi:hypothetical protein
MPRYTIRDLLWLTALLSILIAWWVDHKELDNERDGWHRAYVMQIHAGGGHVSFDVDDRQTVKWLNDSEAEARSERLILPFTK